MSQYVPAATLLFVVLLTLGALACSDAGQEDTDAPLVFAAASLSDVAEQIAESYRTNTPNDVRLSYAGSNHAASQILDAGAPAHAVWFAGWTPMSRIVDAGLVPEHEIAWVCFNQLVIVAANSDSGNALSSHHDLVGAGRIAIPDPRTAPAGEYAQAALEVDGTWDAIRDQVVQTLDVRAALAAVTSGATEFAIVYATDARTEDVSVVFEPEIPGDVPPPFYYAAALSDNLAAAEFIAYLSSAPAKLILEAHGFPPFGGVPEWARYTLTPPVAPQ